MFNLLEHPVLLLQKGSDSKCRIVPAIFAGEEGEKLHPLLLSPF